LPIVTRTIVGPDLALENTMHVFCPMHERALALDVCVGCPFCAALDAGDEGPPTVTCRFEPAAREDRPVPSRAVAHSVLCVRADAVGAMGRASSSVGIIPIVNERRQLVGIADAGSRAALPTEHNEGAVPHALDERVPIAEALATLARRKARRAVVVAEDGTVIGVVEDLALMRLLKERAERR
jgi:CBS domain-containing protein